MAWVCTYRKGNLLYIRLVPVVVLFSTIKGSLTDTFPLATGVYIRHLVNRGEMNWFQQSRENGVRVSYENRDRAGLFNGFHPRMERCHLTSEVTIPKEGQKNFQRWSAERAVSQIFSFRSSVAEFHAKELREWIRMDLSNWAIGKGVGKTRH